jgi:uncharacterized membrane protein
MIKNQIFYFYSCPVTDQQPKNVFPISVATWNFLFILIFDHTKEQQTHNFKTLETLERFFENLLFEPFK